MKSFVLSAVVLAAVGASPAKAVTEVNVQNVGSIFNESIALPAEDAPGSGIGFAQFFEFSLPTTEIVTASVSDSGIGNERVIGGVLSLNTFTSSGPGPLFQPLGAFIESSPFINSLGGQSATVNPDTLAAGSYFVEVSGTSGSSPIHLAIDGTVTATQSIPEPSTWAMLMLGFGGLALFGARKRPRELAL
jgi:hypothetical protein